VNSPIPGEHQIAVEIAAFFSRFFQQPARIMVTTGKDTFYFFNVFLFGIAVITVKTSASVEYPPLC